MTASYLPYTLVLPSKYGQVIVSRYDTHQTTALMKTGASLDDAEIGTLQAIAKLMPEGAVFVDVGANFGLYSLALAQTLKERAGKVIAFEAQRVIYNMVCGSVALNSIENLFVHHLAVSNQAGQIAIPKLDYHQVSSYGSVEFGEQQREFMGQERGISTETVQAITLDSLLLPRVDIIKIDVEGMEEQVLEGAAQLFDQQRPVTLIEWVKSDKQAIAQFFAKRNYSIYEAGMNFLCIPKNKEPAIQILNAQELVVA